MKYEELRFTHKHTGLLSQQYGIHLQRTGSISSAIHLKRTVVLSSGIDLQRTAVLVQ